MDKDKLSAIVSIVVSAVLAILAVFGYNIIVVQPALSSIAAQVGAPVGVARAVNAAPYYESLYVDKELTNAGTLTQSGAIQGASPFVFEGATDDAYETTFAVTDPASSDKTITFPNASGTVALNPAAGTWEFEGTTADDYETTLTVTDPTADRTVTVPDASGTTVLSTLATNAPDAANSVTGASNGWVFEGATANEFETTITPTDPTADRTITTPNLSGTLLLTTTPKVVVFGTNTITDTLTISHGLTTPSQVFCTLTQDSEANAATCSATISSSTVVIKVWKADGATAGSVGKQVAWMVVGTP